MMKRNSPIGIFDSGVGGLTVLKEIRKVLPCEDIVYLGDTAHLPYGTKSKSTISKLSISNILFLLGKKVKLIIVACNSTSAVALPEIKNFFGVPVLGVMEAGVEAALQEGARRIGIIGTAATINSSSYQNLLKEKKPKVSIMAKSCPLFVPLVEEGWVDSSITHDVATRYLKQFKGKIDLLILACTHYPLLKKVIRRVLGDIILIDSAEVIAKKTKQILKKRSLLKKSRGAKLSFFLTDNSPTFSKFAHLILRRKFKPRVIENV